MLENDLSPAVDNTVYLKDYQPTAFAIEHVTLDFQLRDDAAVVSAELMIKKRSDHNEPLILDGEKMKLLGLKIDDRQLDPGEYLQTDLSLNDSRAAASLFT